MLSLQKFKHVLTRFVYYIHFFRFLIIVNLLKVFTASILAPSIIKPQIQLFIIYKFAGRICFFGFKKNFNS